MLECATTAQVVFAEDDPDDVFLIDRALRRARPDLVTRAVRDGIELMEYLSACDAAALPSLLFIDLNMPRMDGREVLRTLHGDARFRHLPVVVLTTSVEPQDRQQAMDLKAFAFISKPEAFKAMVAVLQSLLDDKLGPAPVELQ